MQNLLDAWGFRAVKVEHVSDVYKVYAENGIYCLKCPEKADSLRFFTPRLMTHLENMGFMECPRLFHTLDGRAYVLKGDHPYYVTNWVNGKKPGLKHRTDLKKIGATLAKFHLAARHIPTYPEDGKFFKYGKMIGHIDAGVKKMDEWVNKPILTDSAHFSSFRTYYPAVRHLMVKAKEILEKSAYDMLSIQANRRREIAHGDAAARNFLIDRHQPAILIDFDSCSYDLQLADLAQLLRRVNKKSGFKIEPVKSILNAYRNVNPLSREELGVLYGYLFYPRKFYLMARRYFRNTAGYSLSYFAREIKRESRGLYKMEPFLESFRMEYL